MEVESAVQVETQSRILKELLNRPLEVGATWYLLDIKWFRRWKSFVGYDGFIERESSNPGAIDNSGLLEDGSSSVLKLHLLENLDYALVPKDAWKKLVEWYRVVDGQEPIARRVIKQGYSQTCMVEVYLIELKLCFHNNIEHPVVHRFSRVQTLGHVIAEMRRLFNVSSVDEVRLLSQYLSDMYELVTNLSTTIEDSGYGSGQVLVLETKNSSGSWPRQSKLNNGSSVSSFPSSNIYASYSSSISQSPFSNKNLYDSTQPGLCGLTNLGNTCFMNSALQCMSNVPPLTSYMLSGKWRDELNPDNPLGMRGEIASTYAALIETMWSGKQACAVPRHFKIAVGQFKPEFSGYQQQDSQELMAFLLDGLHEDLNRIRKKPYVAVKETDNRPDEVVAKETWHDYRLRNDSIIVDIFHGLLKSTLVCPECDKVSIKFDPFCYLSLPLPHKRDRQMSVVFVRLNPNIRPRQYKLTVPKSGIVEDLCKALSAITSVPHNKMTLVDLYNYRFHKVFLPSESLIHITARDDIYIYEVPVPAVDDPETVVLPVYMREINSESTQLFGFPLLVSFPRNRSSYSTLYDCILSHMKRFLRNTSASSDGEASQKSSLPLLRQDEKKYNAEKMNIDNTNRLFEVHVINSFGYTEDDKLPYNGTAITFKNHWYLSAEWTTKSRKQFYNEEEAKAFDIDISMDNSHSSRKHNITLANCLELFTKEERLGEQDLWYCPTCKKHQQATKKFDLWDLPQILVIHLKRFSYSRYSRDKLDAAIDYPLRDLDMSPFVMKPHRDPLLYDLIAVSNHFGGLGGGHYTAYAKNIHKNQWFDFDDSSVHSADAEDVVTKAGYVLVYQRRSPDVSVGASDGVL